VQVLTITSDLEQSRQVINDNGYFFPVLTDSKAALAKKMKVLYIHRTFVVDAQGIIRAVYIGYHEDMIDILTQQINRWKKDEE